MIGPRKVDRPLVLYGFGKLGHLAEEIFNELKIPILGIVDKDSIDRGYKNCSLLAICVAIEPYSHVIAPLITAGWRDIVPVWDIISAYPYIGLDNGWMVNWKDLSMREDDECGAVHDKLRDEESKLHYRAFRAWRMNHFDQPGLILAPSSPLPATLADIRRRQRVDMFADAPMKSISIHNEGCELKTLEVNMPLFQRYRPVIDVACYHSRDGLYKIEKFLMDNLPDYTWTFRLYAYCGQAAYLYGSPKEKA